MGDTRNIARRFDDLKSVEVQGKSGVIFTWKMVLVLEVVCSFGNLFGRSKFVMKKASPTSYRVH
jgi:hypothetical protein